MGEACVCGHDRDEHADGFGICWGEAAPVCDCAVFQAELPDCPGCVYGDPNDPGRTHSLPSKQHSGTAK